MNFAGKCDNMQRKNIVSKAPYRRELTNAYGKAPLYFPAIHKWLERFKLTELSLLVDLIFELKQLRKKAIKTGNIQIIESYYCLETLITC